MSILEALGQICRLPQRERLIALLRQQAPTWLMQMPWLLTPEDRERLPYELHGTTRDRMLREFAAVIDTLTATTPLLLVLEDLHWSDYATLDLIAFLARSRTPAQLLVLGTYRPVEAMIQEHPLRTVVYGLQRQEQGMALPLEDLSAAAVATSDSPLPRSPVPGRVGRVAASAYERQSTVCGDPGGGLASSRGPG